MYRGPFIVFVINNECALQKVQGREMFCLWSHSLRVGRAYKGQDMKEAPAACRRGTSRYPRSHSVLRAPWHPSVGATVPTVKYTRNFTGKRNTRTGRSVIAPLLLNRQGGVRVRTQRAAAHLPNTSHESQCQGFPRLLTDSFSGYDSLGHRLGHRTTAILPVQGTLRRNPP